MTFRKVENEFQKKLTFLPNFGYSDKRKSYKFLFITYYRNTLLFKKDVGEFVSLAAIAFFAHSWSLKQQTLMDDLISFCIHPILNTFKIEVGGWSDWSVKFKIAVNEKNVSSIQDSRLSFSFIAR